jgi:hypothetical protein
VPVDKTIGEGYVGAEQVEVIRPGQHDGQYQYSPDPNVLVRQGMGQVVPVDHTMIGVSPVEQPMHGLGEQTTLQGWAELLAGGELDRLRNEFHRIHDTLIQGYNLLDKIEGLGKKSIELSNSVPETSPAKANFREGVEGARVGLGQLVRMDFLTFRLTLSLTPVDATLKAHGLEPWPLFNAANRFHETMKTRIYDKYSGWADKHRELVETAKEIYRRKNPNRTGSVVDDPLWLEACVDAADQVIPAVQEDILQEKAAGMGNPAGPLAVIGVIAAITVGVIAVLHMLRKIIESFNAVGIKKIEAVESFENRLERERKEYYDERAKQGVPFDQIQREWAEIEKKKRAEHAEVLEGITSAWGDIGSIALYGGIAVAGIVAIGFLLPMLRK